MPNKTIYVSDEDLPVLLRAQELAGGNLSGAIVAALRRYIDLEEGRLSGLDEVVLRVGRDGVRQVRFVGSLLGNWTDEDDKRVVEQRVYRSRKDKFVLHTRTALWKDYPNGTDSGTDLKDWRGWARMLGIGERAMPWGDYVMDVYDTVEEIQSHVPKKLYARVHDLATHQTIEDLDI